MVALGVCACVGVVVFKTKLSGLSPVELGAKAQHAHKVHKAMKKSLGLKHSDLSLLQAAMGDQKREEHAACLKECTTKSCKKKCAKLAPGAAATAAKRKAAGQKKGPLGLKKSDLSLLKDAQKARHAEEVKRCKACVSAKFSCHSRCERVLAAAKQPRAAAKAQGRVSLGLKAADLKLLKDAERRQGHEEQEIKAMHEHDAKFLHAGGKEAAIEDVNAQPGEVGEWAPGMRSSALSQLAQEQSDAAATAKELAANDESSSF